MKRPCARGASGQALLEAIFGVGALFILVSGVFVLGIALTARSVLAHALEEHLVCRRSLTPRAACDRHFHEILAKAPGELRVISLRASGNSLRGTFRWNFQGLEKEIRVEENSPLSE